MKICVISSTVFPVHPPQGTSGYSGLEVIAWQTAKGLAEKGHLVALVAPDGSHCPGVQMIHFGPAGQVDEKTAYERYWQALPSFDCIVDHSWAKWSWNLKREGRLKAPVLAVMHAPVNTMLSGLPPGVDKPCVVCISHDQRQHFEALFNRPARTCYNGCFEGSTLLELEGGKFETIGSFVNRRGSERVRAWDENLNRFTFANVRQWMELDPTNSYAVEINVTESELTLISTPDNPIMTRTGWKAAGEITCHDEVLCGQMRPLDRSRKGIRSSELRSVEDSADCREVESPGFVSLQRSPSTWVGETATAYAGIVDRGRNFPSQGKFPLQIQEGSPATAEPAYVAGHQFPGQEIEVAQAEEDCPSKIHFRETEKHTRCCGGLSGRNSRRGRACKPHALEEEIQHQPGSGDCQFGSENHQVHRRMVTSHDLAGGARKSRAADSQQTILLEGVGRRIVGRQDSAEDHSVHDGQEKTGGTGSGILPFGEREDLGGGIQRRADQIVSGGQEGEFQTWKKVVGIRRIPTPAKVFDLQTSTGNFVANGIVVHNCDGDYYRPLGLPRSGRFLFLARFSKIKNPLGAILACKEAGVGLDLIGDTSITNEPDYFHECRRLCDGTQIRLVGPASRGNCVWWFSQAHALIHPVKEFREPFGLAPVEAMLCGCPVIGWRNGALPETVEEGETGLLVNSEAELVTAIKMSKTLEWVDCYGSPEEAERNMRVRCREWASRFSVQNMVTRYEALCHEAVDTGGW